MSMKTENIKELARSFRLYESYFFANDTMGNFMGHTNNMDRRAAISAYTTLYLDTAPMLRVKSIDLAKEQITNPPLLISDSPHEIYSQYEKYIDLLFKLKILEQQRLNALQEIMISDELRKAEITADISSKEV